MMKNQLQKKSNSKKNLLLSNIKNHCLHRQKPTGNWLLVPTFEEIFDILKYHHEKLCHTKDFSKNKNELDKLWYCIPESCIKIFLHLCTLCFSGSNPTKSSKMNPLKLIHSPRVGHRAQIDLIGMSSQAWGEYNHILRYVDHLSGFSHVAPLKSKDVEPIGFKLLKIFSSCIIPEILSSDNGSEFLGDCIILRFILQEVDRGIFSPKEKLKESMPHLTMHYRSGCNELVRKTGLLGAT
jgi:hypothetical protein